MEQISVVMPKVFLQPGEFFLARDPTIISTILGSCLGITFWSPKLRIGALCHALLPKSPQCPDKPLTAETGRRYVDYCVSDLIRQFEDLGVKRNSTQVKLFGGGDMFPIDSSSTRLTVGRMNCDMGLDLLGAKGYHICCSNVGGTVGRKIRFNTGTGDVMVLRLTDPPVASADQEPDMINRRAF